MHFVILLLKKDIMLKPLTGIHYKAFISYRIKIIIYTRIVAMLIQLK